MRPLAPCGPLRVTPARVCAALGVIFATGVIACSGDGGGTCAPMVIRSETSDGTYSYVSGASDGGPPDTTPQRGDLGPATDLAVASLGTFTSFGPSGVGLFEILARATAGPYDDPSAIAVEGTFMDTSGNLQLFVLVVRGVTAGESVPVASTSEACFLSLGACASLTGTITTSTYSNVCDGSAAGCVLTIAGSLQATTTWPGGSFTVDLTLGHEDLGPSSLCP